jgi:hypothetical protein
VRARCLHARAWPRAENAVTDALEVVCDQAQLLLTTYAMPPLRMKQRCASSVLRASAVCFTAAHSRTPRRCFALVEHYGDALSAALYAREPADALHTRFCTPICAAVDAAADAARQQADVSLACARLLRTRHVHALTAALF